MKHDSSSPISHEVEGRAGILTDGLIVEKFLAEETVETEEINQFASGVDLSLKSIVLS